MSNQQDNSSDVSYADVTLLKNTNGEPASLSEVEQVLNPVQATPLSASLPCEPLEPAMNQQPGSSGVNNPLREPMLQTSTYPHQSMRMDGIPPQFLMQMMEMM